MNPPLPSEISAFEPPSPSEFPVTFRGGGMDIFWNHTILVSYTTQNTLSEGDYIPLPTDSNEHILNKDKNKNKLEVCFKREKIFKQLQNK